MNITANKVIEIAKKEVGYEEKASNSQLYDKHANNGRNNFTKYEKELFGSNGNFWCASFVSWVFWEACGKDKTAAIKLALCLSMACETIRQAYVKACRFDKTPQVGSIIFFVGTRHSGANHIGIVTDVNANTISTVEGNTSSREFDDNGGAVVHKTYSRSYSKILGYGHPNYTGLASPYPIKSGDKGENVKEVQRNLNNVISAGLTVDGSYGPATVSAVKTFQKKYGLTINGTYDLMTATKVKDILSNKSSIIKVAVPTIKNGSKGENVKTLQNNLNRVMNAGLTVDGSYGPATVSAVKTFQKKYKLSVDGSYGPATAAKMKDVLK